MPDLLNQLSRLWSNPFFVFCFPGFSMETTSPRVLCSTTSLAAPGAPGRSRAAPHRPPRRRSGGTGSRWRRAGRPGEIPGRRPGVPNRSRARLRAGAPGAPPPGAQLTARRRSRRPPSDPASRASARPRPRSSRARRGHRATCGSPSSRRDPVRRSVGSDPRAAPAELR